MQKTVIFSLLISTFVASQANARTPTCYTSDPGASPGEFFVQQFGDYIPVLPLTASYSDNAFLNQNSETDEEGPADVDSNVPTDDSGDPDDSNVVSGDSYDPQDSDLEEPIQAPSDDLEEPIQDEPSTIPQPVAQTRKDIRIYTIDEANAVAGKVNRVSIKYR